MNNKTNRIPWMDNIFWDGEIGWFVSGYGDILMKINGESKRIFVEKNLSHQKKSMDRLHPFCVKHNNVIVCIPVNAGDFIFYNISTGECVAVPICDEKEYRACVYNYILRDGFLYAYSYTSREIIVVDVENRSIISSINIGLYSKRIISVDTNNEDKFYLLTDKNTVYEYNIFLNELHEIDLAMQKELLRIKCDSGILFFCNSKKEIILYDLDSKIIKEITDFPKGFGKYNFNGTLFFSEDFSDNEFPCFLYMVHERDSLLFIPFKTNMILTYNINTEIMREIDAKDEKISRENIHDCLLQARFIYECKLDNGNIVLYSLLNKCLLEIDYQTKEIKYLDYILDSYDYYDHLIINDITSGIYGNEVINEKESYLKHFLECL